MILVNGLEALAPPTRRHVRVVYTRDEERIRQPTQTILDQLLPAG